MNGILTQHLPGFILVTIFSLLIGILQRMLHGDKGEQNLFGTDRTFTFIGILGYLLLAADVEFKSLFIAGLLIVSFFFGIYYLHKIRNQNDYGLTTIMVALLTYCQSLILFTQPLYMYLLLIVAILLFSEMKSIFTGFTARIDRGEFITLAKFIIMAGIILPVVPNEPIVSYLSITPYKIWLAVVVISSISYVSYILRKFVFKEAGLMLIGVLGGLYSSTATTIVLARKSKEMPEASNQITAAIFLAISMMYLRITILAFIFNKVLAYVLLPYMVILFIVSVLCALILSTFLKSKGAQHEVEVQHHHPLEFNVAIVFTLIYVVFTFVNYFAITRYGEDGLKILAVIVGVADIDPFLLNIFQGKFNIASSMLASAGLLAIVSNNFLKLVYAMVLYKRNYWFWLVCGFLTITFLNLVFVFIV